ncbi:hypothetical protein H1R20_g16193, partial [Candolleomyces eurysporus]
MHDSEERYPPPLCHEGTRDVVICRIEGWCGFEIPPEKKIMWVHAPAGFGKTAVAGTVSKKMESRTDLDFNPVGATFFFWRTSDERNSPKHFIITLAYQFTISIPELAPHIEAAVKRNLMILDKALEVQLVKLIVEPFKSLGELDKMPHRLVIIDGLDECINSDQQSRVEKQYAEDQERVQVRVLELIRILHSHNLPLCFLIFSRPEPWIMRHIGSKSFKGITETLDLYQVGDHLKDVERFVRDELTRIVESLDPQPENNEEWPGEDIVNDFLQRAGGHMLYAATVIRHIDDPYDDPLQRLQDVLNYRVIFNSTPDLTHSTPLPSLHELYRQILRSCPQANRAVMVEVLEELLLPQPLSGIKVSTALNVCDRLTGRAPGRGIKALRPLHALVRLSGNYDDRSSPFYHSSFAEFLMTGSQPLPDVTFNVQNAIRRLLPGCLKSLSVVTMDGQADEEHVKISLKIWPNLLSGWIPEEDPSSTLKALLAADLTACFFQAAASLRVMDLGLVTSLQGTCRFGLTACSELFPGCAPLVEDVVTHIQASLDEVLLRLIHPDYLTGDSGPGILSVYMGIYIAENQNRPDALDKVARALRDLLEIQEGLFRILEAVAVVSAGKAQPVAEKMFKLARQGAEE